MKKGYRPNGRRPFSILYFNYNSMQNFCQILNGSPVDNQKAEKTIKIE